MDFPAEWEVFPAEAFETAMPRCPGSHSVELMAQLRPNGRVMDHWRLALGGSGSMELNVPLNQILPIQAGFPDGLRLKTQYWPRDVAIRRNMSSSSWQDVYETLAARQATVETAEGEVVPTDEVIGLLDGLPQTAIKSASLRWAVVIAEDGNLQLDLQSLPAPAKTLAGRPAFKG
jgi:hypothetical protein